LGWYGSVGSSTSEWYKVEMSVKVWFFMKWFSFWIDLKWWVGFRFKRVSVEYEEESGSAEMEEESFCFDFGGGALFWEFVVYADAVYSCFGACFIATSTCFSSSEA